MIQVKHDSCKHVYFWLLWGLINIWSHVTNMTMTVSPHIIQDVMRCLVCIWVESESSISIFLVLGFKKKQKKKQSCFVFSTHGSSTSGGRNTLPETHTQASRISWTALLLWSRSLPLTTHNTFWLSRGLKAFFNPSPPLSSPPALASGHSLYC